MNLGILKLVSSIVVSIGVGSIVNNVVKSTSPIFKSGIVDKVCVWIGGAVIVGMVSDKAIDYADKKIDEGADAIKKVSEFINQE